ncbi:MAG: hypothetical protein [Caudoviricetes sp.]|nr:MAG: hypothetical protein [Caudoviricetes sp.]
MIKDCLTDSFPLQSQQKNGKFKIVAVGYSTKNPLIIIRTSFILNAYESDNKRLIKTRNSLYEVDMDDIGWEQLLSDLKHEDLDLEGMKK